MIDVWLLFNLMYPFLVVLMHTYMDTLRNDADDNKEKERTNEVILKVLQRNCKVNDLQGKDENRQAYYLTEAKIRKQKKQKLQFWRRVSIVHSPALVSIFMVVYWIAGLKHADIL